MGAFVKRFQPKLYNLWRDGKDVAPHPEDDQKKIYHQGNPYVLSHSHEAGTK